jgi:hypothetical protein
MILNALRSRGVVQPVGDRPALAGLTPALPNFLAIVSLRRRGGLLGTFGTWHFRSVLA